MRPLCITVTAHGLVRNHCTTISGGRLKLGKQETSRASLLQRLHQGVLVTDGLESFQDVVCWNVETTKTPWSPLSDPFMKMEVERKTMMNHLDSGENINCGLFQLDCKSPRSSLDVYRLTYSDGLKSRNRIKGYLGPAICLGKTRFCRSTQWQASLVSSQARDFLAALVDLDAFSKPLSFHVFLLMSEPISCFLFVSGI